MRSTVLAVFAALAGAGAPAQAEAQATPVNACTNRNSSHDERIADCTAVINTKRSTGRTLATAYCNRGFALRERRELDRALANLEEAVKIDAKYACPFSNRARVWAFKGDLDRAIAD